MFTGSHEQLISALGELSTRGGSTQESICRAAVDEIDLLRNLLAEYRDKTPLGHQPYMIADRADKALGRD